MQAFLCGAVIARLAGHRSCREKDSERAVDGISVDCIGSRYPSSSDKSSTIWRSAVKTRVFETATVYSLWYVGQDGEQGWRTIRQAWEPTQPYMDPGLSALRHDHDQDQ